MAKVQNRSTKNDPVLEALPLACAQEGAAVEFMEKQRWADNAACPRCGDMDVYQMKDSKTGERQVNYRWRCLGCKKQFTVRTGTVFEDSRKARHTQRGITPTLYAIAERFLQVSLTADCGCARLASTQKYTRPQYPKPNVVKK